MDTTRLFNFEFVDRYQERKIFSSYTNSRNIEHILWITGERGVGKTRFVKQMLLDLSGRTIIWVDDSIQSENEIIILDFLNKLQKIKGNSFYDFVKDNYHLFWESGKDFVKVILSNRNFFWGHLTDLLFDATSKVMDKNSSSRIFYKIFISYIDNILENNYLFIVFDNFSRYDNSSIQIIFDLIRNYINNDKIRFCIITTDNDMILKEELETQIYMSIPFKNILIQEFSSYIFFGEILHKIFGKALFNYDDVKYIYEKCGGNPENLIKILKKSFKRNAISLNSYNITINKEILYTILRTESTRFSANDFTFKEQLLLLDIICIGKVVNQEFLKLTVEYLACKIFMFKQFSDEIFFETLGKLINHNIIVCGDDNTLVFEHDSIFLDICDILYDMKLKPQICQNLYELLLKTDLSLYGYSEEDYEYYKAYYAAEAYIPGWERINFEYGNRLIERHLYHKAIIIFDKLPITYFYDSPKQLYTMAYAYFEDGQFSKSLSILKSIFIDTVSEKEFLFKYYFLMGKTQNILTEKLEAISCFNQALKLTGKDSSEFVETLNLLHLTYMETEKGRKKAKIIFEYVKDNYETVTPLEWAKTMRGIANFYDGNNALELLHRAIEIAIQKNDKIEQAYIENSMGFIYLRNGDIEKAEYHFSLAYEILHVYKTHETSYALNNRAICYMLNEKYEDALIDLLQALLWNSTPYAYYTINSHLCNCYLLMNKAEEAGQIISMLEHYILYNKIEDPVMLRKLTMTLGIAHHHMNNITVSRSFFSSLSIENVISTSSEYRYRIYTNQTVNDKSRNNLYFKNKNFEPWILIYGHD